MTRKSRFDRIAPPVRAKKPKKERKPKPPPDQWVQTARERAAWPFAYEHTHYVHEEVEPDDDEVTYEPKFAERKIATPRVGQDIHVMVKRAVENALTQAYITGYVAVVNYLDVLPFIIRHHSKSKKLLKEVNELVARIKDDLKSGRRHY